MSGTNITTSAILARLVVLETSVSEVTTGVNDMWHIFCGIFIVLMLVGFAMIEAGTARRKLTMDFMSKNILSAAVCVLLFWLVGYTFAFGRDKYGMIGFDQFALQDSEYTTIDDDDTEELNFHTFFLQWAYAAVATTIAHGCLAERCTLWAYLIYTAVVAGFIYPVVVHWTWGDGWLSPFGNDRDDYLFSGEDSNNVIDFAGSGVVHMVGGFTGIVGAVMLGPRKGRFLLDGTIVDVPGQSIAMVVFGVLILWVGFFAFTAGATLCITGTCAKIAAKVVVMTALSGAAGAFTVGMYQIILRHERMDMLMLVKGLLAGLVSVCASCNIIEPWAAWTIGTVGGIIYLAGSIGLREIHIDDPLDACPIHGVCGYWGVVAVGLFGNDDRAAFAGYVGSADGHHPFRSWEQLAVQFCGATIILAWSILTALLLFAVIYFTMGLRISEVEESARNGGVELSEEREYEAQQELFQSSIKSNFNHDNNNDNNYSNSNIRASSKKSMTTSESKQQQQHQQQKAGAMAQSTTAAATTTGSSSRFSWRGSKKDSQIFPHGNADHSSGSISVPYARSADNSADEPEPRGYHDDSVPPGYLDNSLPPDYDDANDHTPANF